MHTVKFVFSGVAYYTHKIYRLENLQHQERIIIFSLVKKDRILPQILQKYYDFFSSSPALRNCKILLRDQHQFFNALKANQTHTYILSFQSNTWDEPKCLKSLRKVTVVHQRPFYFVRNNFLHEYRLRRKVFSCVLVQCVRHSHILALATIHVTIDKRISRVAQSRWGGRVKGSRNIQRGLSSWIRDYLHDDSVYQPVLFRRRFGIRGTLFGEFEADLVKLSPSIQKHRKNAVGHTGIESEWNILGFWGLLRTGRAYEDMDDSLRMGEETLRVYPVNSVGILNLYMGKNYLIVAPRSATQKMSQKAMQQRGLPGVWALWTV